VPECERVFVVGDVKRPGAFPFLSVDDTTVLQLLALSGGLDSFSRNKAYIYRTEPGNPKKREIGPPETDSGSKGA
jgi:polysaccharide biosynthesis/export protein